jgi:hypothetical protein
VIDFPVYTRRKCWVKKEGKTLLETVKKADGLSKTSDKRQCKNVSCLCRCWYNSPSGSLTVSWKVRVNSKNDMMVNAG